MAFPRSKSSQLAGGCRRRGVSERNEALLPAGADGGVEHVLGGVPEAEAVVEELPGGEVDGLEVVVDACELVRDAVLGEPVPEHRGEAVDGGVVGGADVAAVGLRVLEEKGHGVAEVVQVDQLHLLQDRVVGLVPGDEREGGDEAGRHAGAEEGADDERGDDADEVQAVLAGVLHGGLLCQGLGHEVHPSCHLDAAAEVDVAPVVLVVGWPLPLLDVDAAGGGGEDDALHGASLFAGPHDAQHPFHRRLDHLVLGVLGVEVHGRGDVEDAGAAGDGVVEAALVAQVGLPDGQPLLGSGKLQQRLVLLNVGRVAHGGPDGVPGLEELHDEP